MLAVRRRNVAHDVDFDSELNDGAVRGVAGTERGGGDGDGDGGASGGGGEARGASGGGGEARGASAGTSGGASTGSGTGTGSGSGTGTGSGSGSGSGSSAVAGVGAGTSKQTALAFAAGIGSGGGVIGGAGGLARRIGTNNLSTEAVFGAASGGIGGGRSVVTFPSDPRQAAPLTRVSTMDRAMRGAPPTPTAAMTVAAPSATSASAAAALAAAPLAASTTAMQMVAPPPPPRGNGVGKKGSSGGGGVGGVGGHGGGGSGGGAGAALPSFTGVLPAQSMKIPAGYGGTGAGALAGVGRAGAGAGAGPFTGMVASAVNVAVNAGRGSKSVHSYAGAGSGAQTKAGVGSGAVPKAGAGTKVGSGAGGGGRGGGGGHPPTAGPALQPLGPSPPPALVKNLQSLWPPPPHVRGVSGVSGVSGMRGSDASASGMRSAPPPSPRRSATIPHPPPPNRRVQQRRSDFDRRAMFARTKFRPRPVDEHRPAPAVGPDGYRPEDFGGRGGNDDDQGGGGDDDDDDQGAGGGGGDGDDDVFGNDSFALPAARRHSFSSTRDFSVGSTPGSDLFDRFGWGSGESGSVFKDSGGKGKEGTGVTAVATTSTMAAAAAAAFPAAALEGIEKGPDPPSRRSTVAGAGAGAMKGVRSISGSGSGSGTSTTLGSMAVPGRDPRTVVHRGRRRRHSAESFPFICGSLGASSSASGFGDDRSGKSSAWSAKEKRREVFALSQRFKTNRINELQDENRTLRDQNEALQQRVAEAQEKAVDFVVRVLQSKGLMGMDDLQSVVESACAGGKGRAGSGNISTSSESQSISEKEDKGGGCGGGDKDDATTSASESVSVAPPTTSAAASNRRRQLRRRSIETASSSVASMIWKSGIISRDSMFSSCADTDAESGGNRALRERCRELRRERNLHHEEAQRALREVRGLNAELDKLQQELDVALEGAELAERRKERADRLESALEAAKEELRMTKIHLEAKSEELELVEEDLEMAKKDAKRKGITTSATSSLTGIDFPSYGTPSASVTSTDISQISMPNPLPIEGEEADRIRATLGQLEELLHQREEALLAAQALSKKSIERIARLEAELEVARQEVVSARAAAGIYRAEMEDEVERADTEARALLRDARREVMYMQQDLEEKDAIIMRLQLELETALEDVEDLKEELKIERNFAANGTLEYTGAPRSETDDASKPRFGGGRQNEDDLLSVLVKVQIENHQLREQLGISNV